MKPVCRYIAQDSIIESLQNPVLTIEAFFDLTTNSGTLCQKNFSFDVNYHHSKTGMTPLLAVCSRHSINIPLARLLLAMGASPNQSNNKYDSPLREAIIAGNAELVKILVTHGAKLDFMGEDFVQLARDHYHEEIADFIASRFKPNFADQQLMLHEDSRAQARAHELALLKAIEKNDLIAAKKLLERHIIHFGKVSEEGLSASWLACVNGDFKILKLLIEHGDCAFMAKNDVTIYEAAQTAGHPECVTHITQLQFQRYAILLDAFEKAYSREHVDNYFQQRAKKHIGFFKKFSTSVDSFFTVHKPTTSRPGL